ncbi:hypothetical protein GQ55_1G256900 [Panicum hallii var. hallii]|uniref:Uncharacterized protein n=1 Tax=Panicum hallii var. hallii TaxID=1504633 RepID=A0A2T7F7G1_9POAL|nr:hypothetical protein GQ55_1G256900 [Panicum hallii var. hallii]
MGAAATTAPCGALLRRSCGPLLALLLCFQVLRTSQAFKLRGGYEEEKVPLTVIVPDPSPQLSGLSPAPLAAPPPVFGGGGGGDDMRPRLPTERWRRGRGRPGVAPRTPRLPRLLPTPTRRPRPRQRHRLACLAPRAAPLPGPKHQRRRRTPPPGAAAPRPSRAAPPCRSRAASRTPPPSCPCRRPAKSGRKWEQPLRLEPAWCRRCCLGCSSS